MTSLLQDLKYGARALARSPGFTAVAVGILALGIGATTAVFSVIDVVFFQPLPIEGQGRLVRLRDFLTSADGRREELNTSAASFEAIRSQNRVFDRLVAFQYGSAVIPHSEIPERVSVVGSTGGLRATLGVAIWGRDFTPEELGRGRDSRVALLSHALWNRDFGASRGVLGSAILLDGTPHTVIGVLSEGFRFPYDADVWVPVRLAAGDEPAVFARLRPAVSVEEANRELATIAARMRAAGLRTSAGFGMVATPARRSLIGDEDRIAVGLLAVVGFFLLLTCADVGSLMTARSVSRRTEEAIRTALGASRLRLLAASLLEAFWIALAASGIGILLYGWIRAPLATLIPGNFREQLGLSQPPFDGRLIAFVVAAAAASALFCAAVPALRGVDRNTEQLLRETGRSAGGGRRVGRALSYLVAAEIALSMTLLCGALLFTHHLWRLERRELGIRTRDVLSMRLALPRENDGGARARKLGEVRRALGSVAGVAAAGATTVNPLAGGTWVSPLAVDGIESRDSASHFLANYRLVTPGLFSALGMAVRDGREFDEHDSAGSAPVAIVSRSMARRFWPGVSPLGRRLRFAQDPPGPWRTVVGVVGDVADAGDVRDAWYVPYGQLAAVPGAEEVHLMVRALPGAQASALSGPVRRAIARVDGSLAAYDVRTQEEVRREVLARERFGSTLIAVLAAFGTLIALLGAYAVTSYRIERRRGELSIRLALGARPAQVLRGTLLQGLLPILAGIGASAPLALAQTAILGRLVPGLGPFPLAASVVIAAGLAGAAAAGLLLPAWKAARTDPVHALRGE